MAAKLTNAGLYVTAFFAISVSLYALSYYGIQQGFLASKGNLATTLYWRIAFYTHITSGAVALGIGWIQFLQKFRERNINRHRLIGKVYAIAILCFASVSGMVLAFNASEGLPAQVGFGCLAFAWFYTTLTAWLSIVKGQVRMHKTWMIRSYALTLAAVTLRIWLPLSLVAGINFHNANPTISWFCWVPNLLVAEWFIIPRAVKRNITANELATVLD